MLQSAVARGLISQVKTVRIADVEHGGETILQVEVVRYVAVEMVQRGNPEIRDGAGMLHSGNIIHTVA